MEQGPSWNGRSPLSKFLSICVTRRCIRYSVHKSWLLSHYPEPVESSFHHATVFDCDSFIHLYEPPIYLIICFCVPTNSVCLSYFSYLLRISNLFLWIAALVFCEWYKLSNSSLHAAPSFSDPQCAPCPLCGRRGCTLAQNEYNPFYNITI